MPGPKLRTVSGVKEPYPIGDFPEGFIHTVAGEISVLLAMGRVDLEGKDWEQIFAKAIGAEWRPSNVGLDDILMENVSAAWGAKTIKNNNPFSARKVRLISGRNSPVFSYDVSDVRDHDPADLGRMVLEIWNERVASLYRKYKTLRTVVLLKGPGLKTFSIFEMNTIRYYPAEYSWYWNRNNNLLGEKGGETAFTWQPHGSQFTVHAAVPDYTLNIELRTPTVIKSEDVLKTIGFDKSCYRVVPRGED